MEETLVARVMGWRGHVGDSNVVVPHSTRLLHGGAPINVDRSKNTGTERDTGECVALAAELVGAVLLAAVLVGVLVVFVGVLVFGSVVEVFVVVFIVVLVVFVVVGVHAVVRVGVVVVYVGVVRVAVLVVFAKKLVLPIGLLV